MQFTVSIREAVGAHEATSRIRTGGFFAQDNGASRGGNVIQFSCVNYFPDPGLKGRGQSLSARVVRIKRTGFRKGHRTEPAVLFRAKHKGEHPPFGVIHFQKIIGALDDLFRGKLGLVVLALLLQVFCVGGQAVEFGLQAGCIFRVIAESGDFSAKAVDFGGVAAEADQIGCACGGGWPFLGFELDGSILRS